MTKEDFAIVAGGIENVNDGQLDSTEILKNGIWEEGTQMHCTYLQLGITRMQL